MKKLSYLTFMLFFVLAACGHDEPDDTTMAERPQDGNGKVFLENGTLVDANLYFKESDLIDALSQYEWEREYCFYYDDKKVSGKTDISGLPIKMHTDLTMEYDFGTPDARIRYLSFMGKRVISTMHREKYSSTYYLPINYIVMSLDLSENAGRIVMDLQRSDEVEGFDSSTLHARMVWKAIIP